MTDRDCGLESEHVNEFPSIGDYGAVGDCRTVALISRAGAIEWLCLPHYSGPALFAALLDRQRGGTFYVRPTVGFRTVRRYLPDTNVLETRFATESGEATLTDALVMLPDVEEPGALCPQNELLRRLEVLRGSVSFEIHYQPRPDTGRVAASLTSPSKRTHLCQHRDHYMVLQSERPLELSANAEAAFTRVTLEAGERMHLSLAFVQRDMGILPPLGDAAALRLERTCKWWQNWAKSCAIDGPYRDAVVRSVLVLKLLQHCLTGAMVAAPTTSLPEVAGGTRNWDYRYCWLRDAALTFQAFADLGFRQEAGHFLAWLLHATRLSWPELNIMYDIFGEPDLRERELDHLEGYLGSRPVREGNSASSQVQLDVYGAVIQAASRYVRSGGRLDRQEARLLRGLGDTICKQWREPDSGIWEIRGARRHYTYSKMMCWSGLDVLLVLHEGGHVRIPRTRFLREREAIAEMIEAEGYSTKHQAYVQTLGGERPDASLLRAARHYRDATDPRMARTFAFIDRELSRGPLVYRYPPETDSTDGREGAFVMTSFWAVEYLALARRTQEARERFEALLARANDLGLYAEEVDPDSGRALGNFPQAFSHGSLITAALALQRATADEAES